MLRMVLTMLSRRWMFAMPCGFQAKVSKARQGPLAFYGARAALTDGRALLNSGEAP
jgi:hypothetical protein